MERGLILSLKRKISQGQLREVVKDVLAKGEMLPEELIVSIREALEAGQILDSGLSGKLIICTRDCSLFLVLAMQSTMLSNYEVLCELLGAGIPDKSIEQKLCEMLASDFEKDHYGRRQLMLEAIRDYGSISSLDTLEGIEYDFFSRHKLAGIVLNGHQGMPPEISQEFVDHISRKMDLFLGDLLKDTITAVRQRNDIGDDLWGSLARRGDPFSRAGKYRDSSSNQLDNNDLGASLNYLRKATEAMLKTVIELEKLRPDKNEPIVKMQLPALMAILMDKKYGRNPDKTCHKYLEQLRDNTTLGSHDQGEETESLYTAVLVRGQIEIFDIVLKYFRDYVKIVDPIRELD